MNIRNLSGDLTGGFIAAAIALPQALAFGTMTGIGAANGIWGAIILCFCAAAFGVKVPIISGPTGPVAIVVASVFAGLNGNIAALWAVLFLAGIFQIILSFTKIPSLVKYVPYPVISGFMNGVGVILIILQIAPFLGAKGYSTPIETFSNFSAIFGSINTNALVVGLLCLGILIYTPKKIKSAFPVEIIALAAGAVFANLFKLDVPSVTGITSGFPKVVTADFGNLVAISIPALTVALIASVETLMTGLVITSLSKKQVNNQTIIFAQGIGNAVASLFGGLTGSGATMRSVAAVKTGAVTRFSGIFSALILLALVLFGGNAVNLIPLPALAAILIYVGLGIIDTKFLKVLKYAPKDDLIVMFLVFFLTVFHDIIFAIGVGITLAAMLFAKRVADKTTLNVIDIEDDEILEFEKEIFDETSHKIRVVHIRGEFFFGSASMIISRFDEFLGTKTIVLCLDSDKKLDISAVFALEDIILRLKSQDIQVYLVLKNKEILKQIDELNLEHNLSEDEIFYEETEAVKKAKENLTNGQ